MNKQAWADAIVFVAIGILCIVEARQLSATADPHMLHQELRPGLYVLILGIVLVVAGVTHAITQRGVALMAREVLERGARQRLAFVFGTLVGYAVLLPLVGYAAATFVSFVLLFRIFGVRSWPLNAVLSAASAAVFYVVFVRYCGVVFPRGALFG